MVTKKPLGAEPSAAVHAAAGDALLSLSADVRLPHRQSLPQHLLLRVQVVMHHVKSTPLWWSTMSASRMKWPTHRGENYRLCLKRRLIEGVN